MPMIHVLFVNMANLWTALRSLGLPSKTSSCEVNNLTIKNQLSMMLTQFWKVQKLLLKTGREPCKNVPQTN